jgi:hypothetical protein
VRLEAPGEVSAGGEIAAKLIIDDASNIMGCHATLRYSSDVLRYLGQKPEGPGEGEGTFVSCLDQTRGDHVDLSLALLGAAAGTAGAITTELYFEAGDGGAASIEVAELDLRSRSNALIGIAPEGWPDTKSVMIHDGPGRPTGSVTLWQNTPNPFMGNTRIGFLLPRRTNVRIEILDTSGRLIRRLLDRECIEGSGSVVWDGRTGSGREVAAGVYIYRLEAGGTTVSRKLLCVR